MRIVQLHTPEGIIEANDGMSDEELYALGVKDRELIFPETMDTSAEIKELWKRIKKLEGEKE